MFSSQFRATSKSKKFSNDETEILTSPKFTRKNVPQSSIKITQNEVEEKLKSMKLKRLSRLGTSSVDHSQIFEETQKVDVHNETEKVVSTKMVLGEDRTKPSFKGIVEEILGRRVDQELKLEPRKAEEITSEIDKTVAKNKSSTKKFINKFNCVIIPNEVSSDGNIEVENDTYLKHVDGIQEPSLSIGEIDVLPQYEQNTPTHSPHTNISHRKTIYFNEHEAALPDLISTASSGAIMVNTKQLNSKEKIQAENDNTELEEAGTMNVSTNGEDVSDKRKEIILREKLKMESNIFRNSSDLVKPPQSPFSSRRVSREDRILKKLQRSCKSLDEILKYDSDVDLDEIDDMKTTLDEAATLLKEYQTKLSKLEEKMSPIVSVRQRLCGLKVQLIKVKEDVGQFNGLKRDLQYMQLCNRLSNFYLEVHKISTKFDLGSVKRSLHAYIDECIKELEAKASRNERILMEILNEQVECIGNKYLSIMNIS